MATKSLWIDPQLQKSLAFRTLSKTAILVLLDFFSKRQMKNFNHPKKGVVWTITNNGEIQYSYNEAMSRGISKQSFRDALDQLIERGFIEVAHSGAGGKKGDVSLYSITDNWQTWRKGSEPISTRPKDTRKGVGFALVHRQRKENIGKDSGTRTSKDSGTSKAVNS